MNLRRLLAISRKEVIQVLRDSRSLLIVLLMPLMLMTTLGYGVNLDTKHIKVFALDEEGSQASQDLLKRFQSSEYFDLVGNRHRLPCAGDRARRRPLSACDRDSVRFLGATARRTAGEHTSSRRWLRQQHR